MPGDIEAAGKRVRVVYGIEIRWSLQTPVFANTAFSFAVAGCDEATKHAVALRKL